VLFSDEHVFDLMGTLECSFIIRFKVSQIIDDPELPRKQNHREYLKNFVVFREVVPFDNPALVAKIHMTFRISYMKDVVLPRLLDDPTFATLNSLIFFNNVEIVGQIQSDAKFLSEVYVHLKCHRDTNSLHRFRRIKSPDIAPDQFKDLVMFIQELCNLAKALQPQNRVIFYQCGKCNFIFTDIRFRNLSKYGFLDIFELSIESKDVPVRLSM
jgi:protein phosphatase-4 regulatory subunit 3